jgi:coatomer subunit gamma
VTEIIDILGMFVHEGSEKVPIKATTHSLLMSGVFIGGVKVCVKCRMALEAGGGVTLEVSVRSSDSDISQLIADSVC